MYQQLAVDPMSSFIDTRSSEILSSLPELQGLLMVAMEGNGFPRAAELLARIAMASATNNERQIVAATCAAVDWVNAMVREVASYEFVG